MDNYHTVLSDQPTGFTDALSSVSISAVSNRLDRLKQWAVVSGSSAVSKLLDEMVINEDDSDVIIKSIDEFGRERGIGGLTVRSYIQSVIWFIRSNMVTVLQGSKDIIIAALTIKANLINKSDNTRLVAIKKDVDNECKWVTPDKMMLVLDDLYRKKQVTSEEYLYMVLPLFLPMRDSLPGTKFVDDSVSNWISINSNIVFVIRKHKTAGKYDSLTLVLGSDKRGYDALVYHLNRVRELYGEFPSKNGSDFARKLFARLFGYNIKGGFFNFCRRVHARTANLNGFQSAARTSVDMGHTIETHLSSYDGDIA